MKAEALQWENLLQCGQDESKLRSAEDGGQGEASQNGRERGRRLLGVPEHADGTCLASPVQAFTCPESSFTTRMLLSKLMVERGVPGQLPLLARERRRGEPGCKLVVRLHENLIFCHEKSNKMRKNDPESRAMDRRHSTIGSSKSGRRLPSTPTLAARLTRPRSSPLLQATLAPEQRLVNTRSLYQTLSAAPSWPSTGSVGWTCSTWPATPSSLLRKPWTEATGRRPTPSSPSCVEGLSQPRARLAHRSGRG